MTEQPHEDLGPSGRELQGETDVDDIMDGEAEKSQAVEPYIPRKGE